jgi:hypothetical protein
VHRLEALTYLNAPFPRRADDFFWSTGRSSSDARRCYRLGRTLLTECRSLLLKGRLIARGHNRDGILQVIPRASWIDHYPMFATNRVFGRTRSFESIEVFEQNPTPAEEFLGDLLVWLGEQRNGGVYLKKTLENDARRIFGDRFTKRMFDVAYKAVFNLSRGHRSH